MNDNAVAPEIGIILMVAITVILAAVIAAPVFEMSGNIKRGGDYQPPNETFTIIDRVWDGDSGHFGYITTSTGDAYRVYNEIDYMRMQINHTYNVEIDTIRWNYPVITKLNYEVFP